MTGVFFVWPVMKINDGQIFAFARHCPFYDGQNFTLARHKIFMTGPAFSWPVIWTWLARHDGHDGPNEHAC